MSTHTSNEGVKFNWQHWVVIAVGLLVFVLLFFAKKTTLENDNAQAVDGSGVRDQAGQTNPQPETQPAGDSPDVLSLIPALEISSYRDSLVEVVESSTDKTATVRAYQAMVESLRNAGRFDAAAVYAEKLAQFEPSAKNSLVAGALFRAASQAPDLLEESELFRIFSDRALANLEQAKQAEPENEEVLIELGLTYIQSGVAENSMQGIQSLLKVVELNPNNAEAAFHLGMFSLQTGQLDKAETRFSKVLEIQPDNLVAKYYLATVYLDNGQTPKAINLLEQLTEQSVDPALASEAEKILLSLNNK